MAKDDNFRWEPKVSVVCCGSDTLTRWSQDRDSGAGWVRPEWVWATAGWRSHPALPPKE